VRKPGAIRIGTSGWIYRHWRERFYPQKLPVRAWFAYYARRFDTVEINNSFYRLPSPQTFAAWRQQAPRGFLYAVKASRYLTHMKKLKDPEEPLETMLDRARLLGLHLGPILYQLPPHWHCDLGRLAHFLALLPADLTHVFEFREASWFNEEVRSLLAEASAGFCIHDLRGFECPLWATGPAVYLRFHGPTAKAYAGGYDPGHLRRWAKQIHRFQQAGHCIYAYFNNDDRALAVRDALLLREFVAEAAPVGRR
jgi:uncharacterized protein YecE (DUF72 family)